MLRLNANEQFCSDHRCCEDCLTREITCKDANGREFKKTQYYHKQVYAQLSGPQLSVILDVEPMRQGEEECAAALRLLRRIRRQYGPRFFGVVVVDSWYAQGPFLRTVVNELGWPAVAGDLAPYVGADVRARMFQVLAVLSNTSAQAESYVQWSFDPRQDEVGLLCRTQDVGLWKKTLAPFSK